MGSDEAPPGLCLILRHLDRKARGSRAPDPGLVWSGTPNALSSGPESRSMES